MTTPAPYDLAPLGTLLLVGALFALAPLGWVWLSERRPPPAARLQALTWVTLFLTFDLVLFGAFTRLTDSGLGCPDWPGCYGHASPLGAGGHIDAAQQSVPTGPVTHSKAWIEMTHRYLATGVGALIVVLAVWNWIAARRRMAGAAPGIAVLTLLWVCLQGAFGALTVTMKLYPAIVTLHLLGGIGLLVLLACQTRPAEPRTVALPRPLLTGLYLLAGVVAVQMALGGWVSTNYAVLACSDFPTCQGAWWPPMDFEQAFRLRRELGAGVAAGEYLPFAALTAIHMAHRLGAAAVLSLLAWVSWRLAASKDADVRRWAWPLAGVGLWQLMTGLGNVLLGWPLAAAVGHTGGAAALAIILTLLLRQARPQRATEPAARPAGVSARAAS
ncbi:MAG: COX15/CtaA family protein [Caldimonas sp.]